MMADGMLLWICDETRLVSAEALEPLLDDAERARRDRFLTLPLARQYMVAHALLRLALSSCCPGIAPSDWRFTEGSHGKPAIAPGLPPLAFSLAHTRGLVALVVAPETSGPLGLDVESEARTVDLAVARRFFAPGEVAGLEALPEADRQRRFFEIWSLKESYLKATGLGLALPLDAFSFTFEASGHLGFARNRARVPEDWREVAGIGVPLGRDARGVRDFAFTQRRVGENGAHALALCRPQGTALPVPEHVEAVLARCGGTAKAPDVAVRRLGEYWDWASS